MKNGKWAMLANIFKPILLWVSGGVVAAGLAGYVIIDSYNQTKSTPEIVAEKEMPKVEKPVEVASLPEKQVEITPEASTKPIEQSPVASAPKAVPEYPLPRFDILRVEEDGYAVIAGSAPSGSKVEILDGDIIIATEKAGSTNEFVVVLDNPLAPGPHDLIIQATLDSGKILLSVEAGVINIPDGKNELLAMVTEPGKASRILQLPEQKQEAPKQQAAKEVAPEIKQEVAKEVAPETKEVVKEEAPKEMPKEVVKEVPVAAPKVADQPAVEVAEIPEPAPEPTATPEPKIVEQAKKEETQIASLEQPPKEVSEEAPKIVEEAAAKVEETKAAPPKIADEPKPVAKVMEPAKPTEPAKPKVPVLIQAAEVEGKKLFIAGTGQSGTSVHIYIDGKFLGKTTVGAEGAYVFEGTGGLDAGRHAVRADMLAQGSSDVIARAVVSLLHEPVVVAPVKVAKVKVEKAKVAKVEPKATKMEASAEKPAETSLEPVKSASKLEIKPVTKKEMVMATKPEDAKISAPARQPKQEQVKVAVVEEKVEVSSSTEVAATPKKMEMTQPATQLEKPAVETASNTEGSVAEIKTGSSVIIRKGDSLWRVSQRRYGRGIRYTTIFDANRDQIRDPDLIYPGQVFDIPEFKEKS